MGGGRGGGGRWGGGGGAHTHTHTHTRTHARTHTHTHTYACTSTHARTHTHTCTRTQAITIHLKLPEVLLDLAQSGGAHMKEGAPHETREDLRLVLGRGGGGDLVLEAGVRDELDGELEHEAVWVLV